MDEPAAGPPPRKRAVRIEVATGLLFAALMALAATAYPPFREAIDGVRQAIVSLSGSATWAGYYVEIDDALEGDSVVGGRLVFASGTFPGRPARLIDPPFWPGRWSPSGDQFAFTSGSRLLIGDRHGAVRLLGELLDLVPAGPPVWAQEHEVVLTMRKESGAGWWLVRADPRTGTLLDQRALPPHILLESMSKDGRWALAWDGRTTAEPAGPRLLLYEPATGREVTSRDGESFGGWAPDGRVLVRALRGQAWRLEARDPGAAEGEALSELAGTFGVPALVHGTRIALVEIEGGRSDPTRAIWLVTPGEGSVRLAGGLGAVYYASPSSDGRYVAFSEEVPRAAGSVELRTGIIEVATKRVTYACERGCAVLDLR